MNIIEKFELVDDIINVVNEIISKDSSDLLKILTNDELKSFATEILNTKHKDIGLSDESRNDLIEDIKTKHPIELILLIKELCIKAMANDIKFLIQSETKLEINTYSDMFELMDFDTLKAGYDKLRTLVSDAEEKKIETKLELLTNLKDLIITIVGMSKNENN